MYEESLSHLDLNDETIITDTQKSLANLRKTTFTSIGLLSLFCVSLFPIFNLIHRRKLTILQFFTELPEETIKDQIKIVKNYHMNQNYCLDETNMNFNYKML